MILDLRAFEEFPAETTIQAGPGELSPFDNSVIKVDSVDVRLTIQESAQEYFCHGRVKARAVLECARCLTGFAHELEGKINFVACAEEDAAKHRGQDDEEYVTFEGNDLKVSIVEPVRQALMVVLPMKPLCDDDCRGLCQNCGGNLNEKECGCKIETTDPRWDGLKGLSQK